MDKIEDFFKFVHERHEVFMRRFYDELSYPWTYDSAISDYHYTNVYRELDRGTVWYIVNIANEKTRNPIVLPYRGVLFSTLIYRIFNKIETFEALASLGYWKSKEDILRIVKSLDTPFTNAFMVTGSVYPNMDKSTQMVTALDEIHKNLEEVWKDIEYAGTLKRAWELIRQLPGFGTFLAYEVVCDLMYAKILPFSEDDWVNVGPGAKKGLWEIWPQLDESEMPKEISWLRNNQRQYLDTLNFRYLSYPNEIGIRELTLRNIEHSLCEYSKYCRARKGERMKRKWHGATIDDGWYRRALYDLYGIGKGLILPTPLLAGE